MKKRIGFVSNSSSCSYIIRGVEITDDDMTTILKEHGITIQDDELYGAVDELFPYRHTLSAHSRRNYFDQDNETGYVIGIDIGDLIDGSFVELPEVDDTEVAKELAKYGITGDIKTYVKMISNDNY